MTSKMTSTIFFVETENVPCQHVFKLIDCLWHTAAADYRKSPEPTHLFRSLVEVANWLNGGVEWSPADYLNAYDNSPEFGWLAGSNRAVAQQATNDQKDASPPEPTTWKYQGGTRCELRGVTPNLTVIVGWDNPLETFFAQVWDTSRAGKCYEDGRLLLWLGTSRNEVPTAAQLAQAVARYAVLPDDLEQLLDGLSRGNFWVLQR